MTKYATGRLSEFEKGEIIALHQSKQTLAQIAAQVNRPRSTIASFLNRYQMRGHTENIPSGCQMYPLYYTKTFVPRVYMMSMSTNHILPGIPSTTPGMQK